MSGTSPPPGNRREFLTGKVLRSEVEWIGERIAEELEGQDPPAVPSAGPTVRLETTAMATTFAVLMNPGPATQIMAASAALDLLHELESEMTVYREDGELARFNRHPPGEPFPCGSRLFEILQLAGRIARETDFAYDPTMGPLIDLWRTCRQSGTIPTHEQVAATLRRTGLGKLEFRENTRELVRTSDDFELNLGGIGKGYALDVASRELPTHGLDSWLFHGGKSSLLARGGHHQHDGWPVGIRNPLFPKQRLATILLRDRGMSTSGAGVQFFRHEGKRYGHLLDPRTGWPAENVLSVTVLAPTAAQADALSTAFFVLGLEKTRAYCDTRRDVTVLFSPPPQSGKRLTVHAFNLPPQTMYLGSDHELIDEPD
jgi:FAD:protein FMN transferase